MREWESERERVCEREREGERDREKQIVWDGKTEREKEEKSVWEKRENDRIISKTPQARKMKGPYGNNERDGTLFIYVECVESGCYIGLKR